LKSLSREKEALSRANNDMLDKEIDYERNLKQTTAEKINFEQQRDTSEKEKNEQEMQNTSLINDKEKLNKEIENLQKMLNANISSHQFETTALLNKLKDCEAKNNQNLKDLKICRTDYQIQSEDDRNKIGKLTSQLKSLSSEKEELYNAYNELSVEEKKCNTNLTQTTVEKKHYEERYNTMDHEIIELKVGKENLQIMLNANITETTELRNKLKALQEEWIKGKCTSGEGERSSSTALSTYVIFEQVSQEIGLPSTDTSSRNHSFDENRKIIEKLTSELNKLSSDKEALSNAYNDISDEVKSCKANLTQTTVKKNHFEEKYNTNEKGITDLKVEKEDFKKMLDANITKTTELQEKLKDCEAQNNQILEDLKICKTENVDVATLVTTQYKEMNSSKITDLLESNKTTDMLKALQEERKTIIQNLTLEISSLEGKLKAKTKLFDSLNEISEECKTNLMQSQSKLKICETEKGKLLSSCVPKQFEELLQPEVNLTKNNEYRLENGQLKETEAEENREVQRFVKNTTETQNKFEALLKQQWINGNDTVIDKERLLNKTAKENQVTNSQRIKDATDTLRTDNSKNLKLKNEITESEKRGRIAIAEERQKNEDAETIEEWISDKLKTFSPEKMQILKGKLDGEKLSLTGAQLSKFGLN